MLQPVGVISFLVLEAKVFWGEAVHFGLVEVEVVDAGHQPVTGFADEVEVAGGNSDKGLVAVLEEDVDLQRPKSVRPEAAVDARKGLVF